MINRREFSRLFAETYGVTYCSSEQLMKDVFALLSKKIFQDGEDITIPGFGAFKHKTAKPKRVRHPKTGELIVQPQRVFVKFTPSDLLKKNKTAQSHTEGQEE